MSAATAGAVAAPVAALRVAVYEVPTDAPESDGTLEWDSTTIVVVECEAGGETGLGYTYGPAAVATLIEEKLADVVCGCDATAPPAAYEAMRHALRNAGATGPGAMAISAVDVALWDLAARLAGLPLVALLGQVREEAPIYGSGGFCSYSRERLQEQMERFAALGVGHAKIKVGRDPEADPERVRWAREALGEDVALMVDANGAYTPSDAVAWAQRFGAAGIEWLEEPVSSDDRDGLRRVRDHAPGGLAVTAGEYGWSLFDLHGLLAAGAVDVLQPDVTRCGGFTVFRQADALCEAHERPLSAHCAPNLSAHAVCAAHRGLHLEYFHDHVRIESMLFDGTLEPRDGALRPDRSRPGHGLELRRADAEEFRR